MSEYHPPINEMLFVLHDVLNFTHEDLDRDTTEAVLDEAAKLASGVLAPLNKSGDTQGVTLKDGEVQTADGFKEAYKAYCDGGWNAVPFDPAPPMVTSGVRLGTPAGTTRGFGPAEWKQIGEFMIEVLDGLAANGPEGNAAVENAVKEKVEALCARFPIYQSL